MAKEKPYIRWMIKADLSAVIEIEKLAFQHPWGEEEIIENLKRKNCIGLVSEKANQVTGYIFYDYNKDHIDILNIAVHPNFQKQYIGSEFVGRIKNKLGQKRTELIATVSEYNLGAQLFFKKCGLLVKEVKRNYFEVDGIKHDSYIFKFSPEEENETK